ncbi:MAG: methyltransferase [Mediterranea sp.]|jgi:hypothetical protein|nr:methyltransferase [Mediterranea sp.]
MTNTTLDTLLRKTAWTWYKHTHQTCLIEWFTRRTKRQIVRFYTKHPPQEARAREAIEYLREHPLHSIPYPFIEKYIHQEIDVYRDTETGLPYVMHEGKKLFFKRSHTDEHVRTQYRQLLMEQDTLSPHRYTDSAFYVDKGDTLFDIGCAEGNFSLSAVETAAHIVLFEGEPEWVEALRATFAPWKEKVTIVPKWVSDVDDEQSVSMDCFLRDYPGITPFIKIDVEGDESRVLKGINRLLTGNQPAKIALCTYHKPDDYATFSSLLADKGFSITPTEGVLVFTYDHQPPYVRKALIRAVKQSKTLTS